MSENNKKIKYGFIGVNCALLLFYVYDLITALYNFLKYATINNNSNISIITDFICIVYCVILFILFHTKKNKAINTITIIFFIISMLINLFEVIKIIEICSVLFQFHNSYYIKIIAYSIFNLIFNITILVLFTLSVKRKLLVVVSVISIAVFYFMLLILYLICHNIHLYFIIVNFLICCRLELIIVNDRGIDSITNDNKNNYEQRNISDINNNQEKEKIKKENLINDKNNNFKNEINDNTNANTSAYEKLKQLKIMYDDGLISSLEYNDKKDIILKELINESNK